MPAGQFFRSRGLQAFTLMQQVDAGIVQLSPQQRNQVIDNIFRLIQEHPEGRFYTNFFEEIITTFAGVVNPQPNPIWRFSAIIKSKLVAPYVNQNSIGGWLGGASEILDTVRSINRQGAVPTRVAVPRADKSFRAQDYLHPRNQVPNQLVQDIDRTEVHGTTKYYIEVKADAETAVHKVSTKGINQLEGILAVIRNRRARSQAGETSHFNRHSYVLAPAIAITNPVRWLALLTSGVIKLYYSRGFYLMIDGQIISPANLGQLHQNLWTLLALQGPPLNYYELKKAQNIKTALTSFYSQSAMHFPRPSALVAHNFALNAFNLVQQAQQIPAPPPQPP